MIGWARGERHRGGGLLGICRGDYSFSLIFLVCFFFLRLEMLVAVLNLNHWRFCIWCLPSVLIGWWLFSIYLPPLQQKIKSKIGQLRMNDLTPYSYFLVRQVQYYKWIWTFRSLLLWTVPLSCKDCASAATFFIDPHAFKICSLLPQTFPTLAVLSMLQQSQFFFRYHCLVLLETCKKKCIPENVWLSRGQSERVS